MAGATKVTFNRKAVLAGLLEKAEAKFEAIGLKFEAAADSLVPVKTGELKASIGSHYDTATKTLTMFAGAIHAFYVEYGTRFSRAQPFFRPALLRAVPRGWPMPPVQTGEVTWKNSRPLAEFNRKTLLRNKKTNRAFARKGVKTINPTIVGTQHVPAGLTARHLAAVHYPERYKAERGHSQVQAIRGQVRGRKGK